MVGAANDLNIGESGFQSFNNTNGVFHGRTLTPGAGISISNGDGLSGNPTISLTGGGVAIETINGDTGSITGSTVTIYSNNAANNSGSTVKFVNSGTVSTFNVTDVNGNTFIGNLAGKSGVSGIHNAGFGAFAFNVITTGNQNTAFGYASLTGLTTGNTNCALGDQAGVFLVTGSGNTLIGSTLAGNQYTSSESNNICIDSPGVTGDDKVIRVGDTQTSAFIKGITGVTVAASSPIAIDSNGQVSDLGFGTATNVLTSNGAGNSPTWQAAGGGGSATAFFAYASTDKTDVTGNGVNYTVLFDSTVRNDGTAYNTGTGTFTAPSTGFYSFNTVIWFSAGATLTSTSELIVSSLGSVITQILGLVSATTAAQTATAYIVSYSWMAQMTSGDTMAVQTFSNSALQNVTIKGGAISPNPQSIISSFSGFKVGT